MRFLRKFNISARLVTMTITLTAFTIIMCVVGSFNINAINQRTNVVFDKEVKSFTYLQSIRESFLNVGSSLRDIILESGKGTLSKKELEDKIYIIQSYYMDMADDVINFTSNLSRYEDTEADIENIRKIEDLIENDYRAVVNAVIQNVRLGSALDDVYTILLTGDETSSALKKLIDDMYFDNTVQINLAKSNGNDTVKFTIITMAILNGIIFSVSLFMGRTIERSISKPIKELLTVASKITRGDFDVKIDKSCKDEVGNLAGSFSQLTDVIRELMLEMEHMSDRQSDGDIDAAIDESKFMGNYRKVAHGINKMMMELVNDVLAMTKCLTAFGNGDFNADIPQFANKKAIINHSINELRQNLTVISEEINTLIRFASAGDLKKRADTTKYSGDWANMIDGLNNLLGAMVVPINGASSALQTFSQGNLDTRMSGNYQGDFATIERSINMTVSAIASYMAEIDSVLDQLVNNKDFNISIEREYIGGFVTIKESINKILYTFNDIITQINQASFAVSESTQEIIDANLVLSNGFETQSEMVDKLNTEIGVLESKTLLNAENAKRANEFASAANHSVSAANSEMEQMLEAMQEINTASLDIYKINKVINDISFQTNLLALNASIEAARAGVHGSGFAIVAGEVSRLASKSREAASQTTDIIERIIKKLKDGTYMANETAQTLRQVVSQINGISVLMSEIDSSSGNQAESIVQINEDVDRILQVNKDAKTSSKTTLTCSEKLSQQSNSLKHIVEEFKLRS